MTRIRAWVVGGVTALMTTVAVAAPPAEGTAVPDFTLPVLDGDQVTLSEQTGEGPVIVVFFRGAW